MARSNWIWSSLDCAAGDTRSADGAVFLICAPSGYVCTKAFVGSGVKVIDSVTSLLYRAASEGVNVEPGGTKNVTAALPASTFTTIWLLKDGLSTCVILPRPVESSGTIRSSHSRIPRY